MDVEMANDDGTASVGVWGGADDVVNQLSTPTCPFRCTGWAWPRRSRRPSGPTVPARAELPTMQAFGKMSLLYSGAIEGTLADLGGCRCCEVASQQAAERLAPVGVQPIADGASTSRAAALQAAAATSTPAETPSTAAAPETPLGAPHFFAAHQQCHNGCYLGFVVVTPAAVWFLGTRDMLANC